MGVESIGDVVMRAFNVEIVDLTCVSRTFDRDDLIVLNPAWQVDVNAHAGQYMGRGSKMKGYSRSEICLEDHIYAAECLADLRMQRHDLHKIASRHSNAPAHTLVWR